MMIDIIFGCQKKRILFLSSLREKNPVVLVMLTIAKTTLIRLKSNIKTVLKSRTCNTWYQWDRSGQMFEHVLNNFTFELRDVLNA